MEPKAEATELSEDDDSKAESSHETSAEQNRAGTSGTITTAVSDVMREYQEQCEKQDELQKQKNAALVASAAECATAKTFTIFLAGKKGPAQHLRTSRFDIHNSTRLGIGWTEAASLHRHVLWGCHYLGHYLTMHHVEKEGVVPRWNKRNPDKQVFAGSRIVEINGDRGDCKRLTSLLLSGCELNVVVIPKSALTPFAELLLMEKEKSGAGCLAATELKP